MQCRSRKTPYLDCAAGYLAAAWGYAAAIHENAEYARRAMYEAVRRDQTP